ncbi:MAG TPA: hypothetical protein VHZ96_26400 [Frankiaceae bacterium]|jgi:hypothetical protein|nr:hypothetical protein [Frankiaceae bacterium]
MPDDRSEYIAGLRALADVLEQHDDLPLPHAGGGVVGPVTFIWSALGEDEPASEMARIRSLIGAGHWEKNAPVGHGLTYYELTAHVHGIDLTITAFRSAVCERVVIGTREVTTLVPATDAPMVEVTETVEDVEWVCAPLLAEATS